MGEFASGLFINIVTAAIILVVGIWAAKYIKKLVVSIMEKKGIDAMLVSFTSSIAYIALVAFVIIAALGQLGVQTTSFVAIIGAAGLAIGLSLQASLSNLASGVMIIFFKPFKVGDFVEAGGVSGVVKAYRFFPLKCALEITKRLLSLILLSLEATLRITLPRTPDVLI